MENKEFKAGFAAKDKEFFDELWDSIVPDMQEVDDIIGIDFCKGFMAGLSFAFVDSEKDTYDHSAKAYVLNFASNYFQDKSSKAQMAFLEETEPRMCVIRIDENTSQEEIEAIVKESVSDTLAKIAADKSKKDGNNE